MQIATWNLPNVKLGEGNHTVFTAMINAILQRRLLSSRCLLATMTISLKYNFHLIAMQTLCEQRLTKLWYSCIV